MSELEPQAARDLVRRGYDEISKAYRGDDEPQHRPGGASRYLEWVARLFTTLPPQARVREWLVPGGRGLLITGHQACTGAEQGWFGGGQMWWSHADAATDQDWLTAAGLRIDAGEFIPEGDGGHALLTVTR